MTKTTSNIKTNISSLEIEENLSLWNIVGQEKATKLLKHLSLQFINDKMEGRKVDYHSVLISGPEGSGRSTLARAFANAILGAPHYKETVGNTLGMGECLYDYFEESGPDTVFFIRGSENVSNYSQTVIFRLLREQILYVPVRSVRKMREVEFVVKPFLILSKSRDGRLNRELHKLIDWKIELEEYTEEDTYKILLARIKYCLWNVDSNNILNIIAQNCRGRIRKGLDILQMSYSISRGKNRNVINREDVERAVKLLKCKISSEE